MTTHNECVCHPDALRLTAAQGARLAYKPSIGDVVQVLSVLRPDAYAYGAEDQARIERGWVITVSGTTEPRLKEATEAADYYAFEFDMPEKGSFGNVAHYFCVQPVGVPQAAERV